VGTTGNASLQAFAKEAVQRAAGIDMLGIPYKGGAPMMNDLLGGQVDLAVLTLPAVIGQVRANKVVMMGLLSGERAASAPEMPTINESKAVNGVSVEIWAALAGPPGLPAAVVSRISAAAREVLDDRVFTERRAKMGDIAVPWESPESFANYLKAQEATYRNLATGLKLQ
jgi:tripartite-type tricarboxylate transporter receptor subunit TctC